MDELVEFADAVFDGTLEIVCFQTDLISADADSEPILRGSGLIRANEQSVLSFRMVADHKGDKPESLKANSVAGEFFVEADYLRLSAIDDTGNAWRSSRIVASDPFLQALPYYRLEKNVDSLHRISGPNGTGTHSIRMLVDAIESIPFDKVTTSTGMVDGKVISSGWSRTHHVATTKDSTIQFRLTGNRWLEIKADSSNALGESWLRAMVATLEFITGYECAPPAFVIGSTSQTELVLWSGPFKRYRTSLPGPLSSGLERLSNFWSLVEKLHAFLLRQSDIKKTRIEEELRAIRVGGASSFRGASLSLTVGLEALAALLIPNEWVTVPAPESISSLAAHLATWKGDPELVERATSKIGGLRQVTVRQRFDEWAKRTKTPIRLVQNWEKLRNKTAHGKSLVHDQLTSDMYYSAVELFYRLISWVIDYQGPITHTSERGWPKRTIGDASPKDSK